MHNKNAYNFRYKLSTHKISTNNFTVQLQSLKAALSNLRWQEFSSHDSTKKRAQILSCSGSQTFLSAEHCKLILSRQGTPAITAK